MDLTKKSKFLSYVLRHNPYDFGLTLKDGGWANVEDVLKATKLTMSELEEIVKTDKKKRYSFDGNGNIRANQGHSIDVDMKFVPIFPPQKLYHGTSEDAQAIIYKDGIKKMQRQHVHCSTNIETAITVGQRHGHSIVFEIDAQQMHNDGYAFFQSENGVWLTDYIHPRYIKVIK